MSEHLKWQMGNNEYLGAALTWLRLRLERAASQTEPLPLLVPQTADTGQPKRRLLRWHQETAQTESSFPLLPLANITDQQIKEAARLMSAACTQASVRA